jgi:hypothetical protein
LTLNYPIAVIQTNNPSNYSSKYQGCLHNDIVLIYNRGSTTGETHMSIVIFKQTYGEFTAEADGRQSGHMMTITGKRSDGKYMVTHAFGSGKRIKKIYTPEQMYVEALKFETVPA